MDDAAAKPVQPARGFLARLGRLYVEPREAFVQILGAPGFGQALALFVVLQVVFAATWLPNMDPLEFMQARMEEAGRREFRIPEQAQERFASMIRISTGASIVVAAPLFVVAAAAVCLFVFRLFLAADLTFRQSLAIAIHAFLAVNLVTVPLLLLTYYLKGDWSLDPGSVLRASPTLLLDRGTTPKPLYAFLGSLDLLQLWIVWLLATGYGVACRRTTAAALPGVLVPWGILVLGVVAFAAL